MFGIVVGHPYSVVIIGNRYSKLIRYVVNFCAKILFFKTLLKAKKNFKTH